MGKKAWKCARKLINAMRVYHKVGNHNRLLRSKLTQIKMQIACIQAQAHEMMSARKKARTGYKAFTGRKSELRKLSEILRIWPKGNLITKRLKHRVMQAKKRVHPLTTFKKHQVVACTTPMAPRAQVASVQRRSSISIFSIVDSDNKIDNQKPAFRQFIDDRELSKRRTVIKIASWPEAAFPKEKPQPEDHRLIGQRRIWTSLTELLESL